MYILCKVMYIITHIYVYIHIYIYNYIYIYNTILVGGIPTPLKHMKVSWENIVPIYGKS